MGDLFEAEELDEDDPRNEAENVTETDRFVGYGGAADMDTDQSDMDRLMQPVLDFDDETDEISDTPKDPKSEDTQKGNDNETEKIEDGD